MTCHRFHFHSTCNTADWAEGEKEWWGDGKKNSAKPEQSKDSSSEFIRVICIVSGLPAVFYSHPSLLFKSVRICCLPSHPCSHFFPSSTTPQRSAQRTLRQLVLRVRQMVAGLARIQNDQPSPDNRPLSDNKPAYRGERYWRPAGESSPGMFEKAGSEIA